MGGKIINFGVLSSTHSFLIFSFYLSVLLYLTIEKHYHSIVSVLVICGVHMGPE